MQTRVTERGQVSIPIAARQQLGIEPHSLVEWVIEGDTLRVIPIPADPVAALEGSGKKGAVSRLLVDRHGEARRE